MDPDPDRSLPGRITVVAPHMDDELIGCGALLASLQDGTRAHVIYATDGSLSPASPYRRHAVDRDALARRRQSEACAGLEALGVPAQHAHFLGLPDGSLQRNRARLEQALQEHVTALAPDFLIVPFRMDFHPDHLAVSAAVRNLRRRGCIAAEVLEYFAYARWKLLPGGDIRAHLRESALLRFEASRAARERKRAAFAAHATQTTRFFDWQKRANLTPAFVDAQCAQPEIFVRGAPSSDSGAIFRGSTWWIHVVHAVEPRLKRTKDFLLDLLRG